MRKKKNFKYSTLIIGAGLVALSLSAIPLFKSNNSNNENLFPLATTYSSPAPKSTPHKEPLNNHPYNNDLRTENGYLFASALLWNVLTDAQDVALSNSGQSYLPYNWGWNWGFKGAIGFRGHEDNWDFSINAAYLQAFYNTSLNSNSILPNIGYAVSPLKQSNSFYYYDGSLLIAREFNISQQLSFLPLAGAKGAYFQQKASIGLGVPNPATPPYAINILLKNYYWGVGPQVGSALVFKFVDHFAFNAQLDAALLWGKIQAEKNTTNNDTTTKSISGSKYQVVPNFNILVGFIFDWNLCEDTMNLALNLAYECRYFLNNTDTAASNFSRQKGSTSLQGANAGLVFSY
jgi:hypothetical protein